MKLSLPLGMPSGELQCAVRFSRRRTLAIYVYPDQRVELRAPHGCPEPVLRSFLQARADWVHRKCAEFARRPAPPPPGYGAGDRLPLLGDHYPLALVAERPHGVWLAAGELIVRHGSPGDVPALLARWYRAQAETVFAERLAHCVELMRPFGIAMPALRLRHMRSRWGSCSARGHVTLNVDLVRFPRRLIDYVIVHELCHLREFNHGPAFYRLMDAALPDWRARKQELRQLAAAMPPFPRRERAA